MVSSLKVVHFGLGPIGIEIAKLVAQRAGMTSVAAVDVDPAIAGLDLAEAAQLDAPTGVIIRSSLAEALEGVHADVAVHSTGSYLAQVRPQLEELLRAGLHVVSTCEELAYPVAERRRIAFALDSIAKSKGVAMLGTGINPGFAMDALPIFLTSVSQEVISIRVRRVNDAGKRRLPLQRKIGAGLSEAEFQKLVESGAVRHVGLQESIEMLANAMSWKLDRVEEATHPILAVTNVTTKYLTVEAGQVAGVDQVGTGYINGRPAIVLELQMYVGAKEEVDEAWIEGHPSLHFRCETGYPGDVTTGAIVVNAARRLPYLQPGLCTMKDLPPAHYRSN
jgi:4-hydroxy-tetrahydrodipicolinate reductase